MLEAAHMELVREGHLELVAQGGVDERTWLDCDLAALAENRIGDLHGPFRLTDERRAAWEARVTMDIAEPIAERSEWEQCYWLIDEGQRAGTVALSNDTFGGRYARLSSLYVMPSHRGRGTGERAMRRIRAALARQGLGVRLDTHWGWPRAVRFYLRIGMWVSQWKRDLAFLWDPRTPDPTIRIAGDDATIEVDVGSGARVLARAHRRGDALEMDDRGERFEERSKDHRLGLAPWLACSTLCVAIAREGWPLVRSQADYERSYHMDGSAPEALAYKIQAWEAWDRKAGFDALTPRIPGLSYPTWDELSERWAEELREFELGVTKVGS